MRYFKTNREGWLWFVWDGENMWYTGSNPEKPLDQWLNDHDGDQFNPDTLNKRGYTNSVDVDVNDPMFAYETDKDWNRL